MYNFPLPPSLPADIQTDNGSPASSTNSGETLLSSIPTSLDECLERSGPLAYLSSATNWPLTPNPLQVHKTRESW